MAEEFVSAPDIEPQLHNLRVFISVADAESITRAAEQLFKAPSAVTRSIIELERSLGVALFERKPRGMLLNAFGEAALLRARRIQDQIQLAADDFVRAKSRNSAASLAAITNLFFNGRKLQLLIHLVAYRNISSAATQMHMTQAGASMALSRIEDVLGQPLFQRRMEGMVATDATERLVMRARRVFAELRHMVSDLSSISGTLKGSVVIGTTPLGRAHVFAKSIAAVSSHHPGLRVITVESSYDQLVSSLRSGDIDIVFGVLRPPHLLQGMSAEPLFVDRFAVLARAGHPLTKRLDLQLADLLDERWVLPRPISLGRPMIDASFRRQGLHPPKPSIETGDLAILRELLVNSDLITATSAHQMAFEIRTGSLVELPVVLEGTSRDVGFVVREGAMLPPAALAVLEAVRDEVQIERGRREQKSA
jgi:LysR family transcriptional regulator of gallate degradation